MHRLPVPDRRAHLGAVALLAVAAVALAGCAVQLPGPVTLEEAGAPVTDPDGELWVARDLPCGFGSGADEACATLTLLYRDGTVLQARYGQGGPRQVEGVPQSEGARSGLTFATPDEDAAFRDEVTEAWTAMHGEAPDLVRVHAVRSWRIAPDEREGVLRVVEHALSQAGPLPEPTFDCQDCAAPAYWAWGSPRAFADQRFGRPGPDDAAWVLLDDQVLSLHEWLDGTAANGQA